MRLIIIFVVLGAALLALSTGILGNTWCRPTADPTIRTCEPPVPDDQGFYGAHGSFVSFRQVVVIAGIVFLLLAVFLLLGYVKFVL